MQGIERSSELMCRGPLDLARMNPLTVFVAALLSLAYASATNGAPAEIGVKGRSNAYPSIAANGQFAALAWGASTEGGTTDVYVTISRDGGRSFGPAARVNDGGDAASL